ncbi:MAG: pilus assembly protein TadE [Gordonia sp.]|uniref:TadE family type IV pilus minor pilin n=1 Tax=Gordonia sp. (in: high G+C Gram-positive bacteria) TaxID=84139 RepID=UPI000C40F99F|nr:TadE family type IV pilus minor pilin [Gordonia sp. (in: high G+C Gram-positive bacteria)]MAU83868.1 pilus assembly protein TadE [Gordonia sp. (in: high G+C Gram-positive bacteria)]
MVRRSITAIRLAIADDRGMVTVEGAYAIAAIVSAVVIGVGVVAAAGAQIRCTDAAREAARLAAIGDVSAISTALSIAGGDARVSLRDSGTQVIAEVRDNVPLLPLMELSARAVAAKEPHGAEDGVTQPGVTQFGAMPEGRGHHDALVG